MNKLTIAISSRALFDLQEAHEVFEKEGVDAFYDYQTSKENDILGKGVGFTLIEKLLGINNKDTEVEVILTSRNSADSGLRIFNSIEHYGLNITRAAFTSGGSTHPYVAAFGADLFLSSNHEEVQMALENGIAAATVLGSGYKHRYEKQLRLAFDGDAVIFSDEAERIYQEHGLEAFEKNEVESCNVTLKEGPFKSFLEAIQKIQSSFPEKDNPIRTALMTARSAPSHKRVIHTMRKWGIRINESFFLGGMEKGVFLEKFGADIFFDDHRQNCKSAAEYVPTGHVPNGINGQKPE
jgi:5'-nucleotidase